jgi:hypothetical protein
VSKDEGRQETLAGLAKRWLKTQFRGTREEADAIEHRMEERVREDVGRAVVNAVMPETWKQKISDLQRRQEEEKAESARRRRAEHEARPRAQVRMTIPVTVRRPVEPGEALTVELEPLAPIAVGDRSLVAFHFAVPAYGGPGAYDLSATAERDGMESWDPVWFQLALETWDEPFYWVPEYGPASVTVQDDERTIRVRIPMQDASSVHVDVDTTVSLPETSQR